MDISISAVTLYEVAHLKDHLGAFVDQIGSLVDQTRAIGLPHIGVASKLSFLCIRRRGHLGVIHAGVCIKVGITQHDNRVGLLVTKCLEIKHRTATGKHEVHYASSRSLQEKSSIHIYYFGKGNIFVTKIDKPTLMKKLSA